MSSEGPAARRPPRCYDSRMKAKIQVSETLNAADGLRNMILSELYRSPARILQKSPVTPRGERIILIGSYLDTVIEHHESIMLLVRNEKYGSAFALLRPVYESLLRACWVNACANESQLRKLRSTDNHKDIFPLHKDLLRKLTESYGESFQDLGSTWDALCSYAHSGLRQLARRGFRGAKQHGYTPRSIIEVIDFASSCLASLARLYFAITGYGVQVLTLSAMEDVYYELGKGEARSSSARNIPSRSRSEAV